MADMSQIVSRLNVLTNQNRVPWKTTSDKSAFVAVYGDLSVRIASRGDEPRNTIVLGVYDGQGNLIDSTSYDGSSLFGAFAFGELKPLYQSARRIALGADQSLSNLLERINATPPVASE